MVKKRKYEFKKDKRWKKIRFFSVLVLCASLLIICVISGVSKYRKELNVLFLCHIVVLRIKI